MPGPLQAILEAELAAGNEISKVSALPRKCSLLVILRRPFKCNYAAVPGVDFAEINDSHYRKEEYRYGGARRCWRAGSNECTPVCRARSYARSAPFPSVERTCSSGLCPLPHAAYVKR